MTHLEAKRMGLRGLPADQIPKFKVVLKKIHLLIPILVIVVLLFNGYSIERTALYGILSTIVVSMFLKETRIKFMKVIDALTEDARTALGVASATAAAGIIVGVVTKTGLGLKMGNTLISSAGSISPDLPVQLLLNWFFTMVYSLILGIVLLTDVNLLYT